MPQTGPSSCGKTASCGHRGGGGCPAGQSARALGSDEERFWRPRLGPAGCDPSSYPLELYFSGGVPLQLNISTRLSEGPSRSVIYTIFTNSWLWIDWHFRELPVCSRNLLNLSPAAEQEFCSLNLSLNYRFTNRRVKAPKPRGSSLLHAGRCA